MQTEKLTRAVRDSLARLTQTSPDDWFLVFRARYGTEAILQSVAGLQGRGEVITQPFTCTTAINPILSAGHIPVYIDTSIETLSLDVSKAQASTASRAIIMQNTFGIESDMKKARTFADKHRLLLIEDSAHSIGQMVRNKDGSPIADVSIHSFGVEKMLLTKFGGAVWVNPNMKDQELRGAIMHTLTGLPTIDRKTRGKARRYRFCNRLLNHTPAFFEPTLRKILIATGTFEPAIMPEELMGKNHGAPARPDNHILKEMLDGIALYEPLFHRRQSAVAIYLENPPANLTLPKSMPKEGYAPSRFPLLCENNLEATKLFRILREEGHYSGKWYSPTLFPGVSNPELYNYDAELHPVAENISARILNLPTNITAAEAKEILDVLHRETD